MAYDPTLVGTSITIDGIDVRQAFGFESQRPSRYGLQLRRRELELPFKHGVFSQGGTYKGQPVRCRGWMPRANVTAFSRFLFQDTSDPGRTRQRRSLVFWDDKQTEYVFDTVTGFIQFELSDKFMHAGATDCGVEFTIDVVSGFGHQAGHSDFGLDGRLRTSAAPEGGSSGDPAFMSIYSSLPAAGVRTHEDLMVKLGKSSTNPKLISCRTGPMTDFNNGLKMIGNDGVSFNGEMFAPTEILTNPDFEDGMTGWTSVQTPLVVAAWGEVVGSAGGHSRVPTGNHVAAISVDSLNDGIRQEFAATAGKQYTVRVEFFTEDDFKIKFGKATGDEGLVEIEFANASDFNEWRVYEFTMEAESTENYRIQVLSGASTTFRYFVNRISVVESILLNGSMEGTYAGGVAPDWTASGGTPTESSTVHSTGSSTARKSQQMVFSNTSDYLRPTAAISLTANRLYYLSGWMRRTGGAGDLVVENGAASPVTNLSGSFVIHSINVWIRFSMVFDTFGGTPEADFRPVFKSSVGGTTIILDDVGITELTTGGPVFFEPGPYGKRLQVPFGNAVMFEDDTATNNCYVNALGFTLVCQFLPSYPRSLAQQPFSSMIAKVTRSYDVETHIQWDPSRLGAAMIENSGGTRKYLKLEGNKNPEPSQFYGGRRGTRGVVFKYDGAGILEDAVGKLFFEDINGPADSPPGVLKSPTIPETAVLTPAGFPAADYSYNRIILGDIGYWDAFWCYQYGMNDERAGAEASAMKPPKYDNAVFEYGAALASGEELLIDLERGTVEKWDGTSLTNAFALVTGSLPELDGDVPILMIEGGVKGVQVYGKGHQ